MTTLDAFLNRLEPMPRGKARKTLEMQVRVNGKDFMTRAALVETRVNAGAKLRETKSFGLVLESPDGAFLDAENLTKAGLYYAGYLIQRETDALR